MAINIKNINCPQCGSTDVTMISSTRIKCNSCGSQTLVKDVPEHQAVYNETHVHYDGKNNRESRRICSVKNAFSEEQFIRDAWIKLAKADVPMDVFSENQRNAQINNTHLSTINISFCKSNCQFAIVVASKKQCL